MTDPRRSRTILKQFRISPLEEEYIEKKIEASGCRNPSEYYRVMSVSGKVINFDKTEFSSVTKAVSGASKNINQIARHINETNEIYRDDIGDLKLLVREIQRNLIAFEQRLNGVVDGGNED